MIAALFVQKGGAYYGLEGVDPWDVARDARRYAGPYPVVAHPPCSRWCRLAGLVEARWSGDVPQLELAGVGPVRSERYRRGNDGGTFAAALAAVRRFGGVLEHPAFSDAWAEHDLPRPPRAGGWVEGACGGFACYVEQGRYGHPAKKATWLYAVGTTLPELRWGHDPDAKSRALVSWCGNHVGSGEVRPRVGKGAASATPEAFKAELLGMARSVKWDNRNGDPDAVHLPKSLRASTPTAFRDVLMGMAESVA